MRWAPYALGASGLLLVTVVTCRLCAPAFAPRGRIRIERQALAVPPPLSPAAPAVTTAAPAEATKPRPEQRASSQAEGGRTQPPSPSVGPVPAAEPPVTRPRVAPALPIHANAPPKPLRNPPAVPSKALVTLAKPARAPAAAAAPVERCRMCGRPAASWVKVDGERQPRCPDHTRSVSTAEAEISLPASAGEAPPPTPPAPVTSLPDTGGAAPEGVAPSAPASEGTAVQCRGATRRGERCRRKTADASGLCYQHRPR